MASSLTILKARVKLQMRHTSEWNDLAFNQKRVWALVKKETAQKIAVINNDKMALVSLKTRQSCRLVKIIMEQHRARQKMLDRHREELSLLMKVIESQE